MSQSNAQRIAELECLISGKRHQIEMMTAEVERLEGELGKLRKPHAVTTTATAHSASTLTDQWDEMRNSRSR